MIHSQTDDRNIERKYRNHSDITNYINECMDQVSCFHIFVVGVDKSHAIIKLNSNKLCGWVFEMILSWYWLFSEWVIKLKNQNMRETKKHDEKKKQQSSIKQINKLKIIKNLNEKEQQRMS